MRIPVAKLLDRWAGGLALRALAPWRFLADLVGDDAELTAVRTIAVVKFWGVGNAALLLPTLRALRRRYPAASILVVTLEGNRPVFRGAADEVIGVRMAPLHQTLLDLARAVGRLRRRRPDLAIDGEQFLRLSQVLLFLAGARQVIAFDTPGQRRAGLADVRVPYEDARHTARSFLDLARAAGVLEIDPGPARLQVEASDRIAGLATGGRPLIVLHPGSGDNFPGRRWPTRRFGLLARRLVDDENALVAVTGSRAEAALAREVREASGRDLLDLSGSLSLDELIALLDRAALLVSNDTGPVHLASALGVPVLGLYGPNTPRLYGPLSAGSVAFYDPPPCSPCITNFNYKTSRCRNPVCIRAIGVEEVADAALRLLAARGAERSA